MGARSSFGLALSFMSVTGFLVSASEAKCREGGRLPLPLSFWGASPSVLCHSPHLPFSKSN